jgi:23S rRNA (cytosine1962-C5)-methyltransferase
VRGGHPWIFSNEVAAWEGEFEDGEVVDITDARGAFLGRAYANRHSLICARVLTRGRDAVDEAFFVRRLERAIRWRASVYPGEEAVRLVYGESDQLPGLVVDRYGEVLAVQVLTRGMERQRDTVERALQRVTEARGAVLLADSPLRALEGLPLERRVWWGEVPDRVQVRVGGFTLHIDPLAGQKTGLFLDQRENRRLAEARVRGRRALDLCCYQGEWSLHMVRGGAESVLAVDSSEPALNLARSHAEAHGYQGRISFLRADVHDALRRLSDEGQRFGMIVLDPPALVKSRKHLAAGAKAYREWNRLAMELLEEDGILVTCSCSHHLDDAMFRQVLLESARGARRPMRVLEWRGEAPDHPQLLAVPETHYLKCALLQAV